MLVALAPKDSSARVRGQTVCCCCCCCVLPESLLECLLLRLLLAQAAAQRCRRHQPSCLGPRASPASRRRWTGAMLPLSTPSGGCTRGAQVVVGERKRAQHAPLPCSLQAGYQRSAAYALTHCCSASHDALCRQPRPVGPRGHGQAHSRPRRQSAQAVARAAGGSRSSMRVLHAPATHPGWRAGAAVMCALLCCRRWHAAARASWCSPARGGRSTAR